MSNDAMLNITVVYLPKETYDALRAIGTLNQRSAVEEMSVALNRYITSENERLKNLGKMTIVRKDIPK